MNKQYLEHLSNILNTPEYLAAMALDYLEAMGEDMSILNNKDITEYPTDSKAIVLLEQDTPPAQPDVVSLHLP